MVMHEAAISLGSYLRGSSRSCQKHIDNRLFLALGYVESDLSEMISPVVK